MIQKRVSLESIERQKRLKFFGDANEESNKGMTIIGSLTYIQYLDEPAKFEKKVPLTKFKINSSSRAYKPSKERLNTINIPDDFESSSSGFAKGGYIPKNIKNQLKTGDEPISIILKNFPTYLEYNQLKELFRNHFKSYGDIKKITILKDKQNNIKDIAFLEYYNNKDALKLLAKNKKIRMGNQIISIQKSIKKNIKKNLY